MDSCKKCGSRVTAVLCDRDQLPEISIVIPSFNQGAYIERTILSILEQNYPRLELLLIDGGSTDETMRVVSKYQSHFAHVVHERDGGQADAIRKGFELARGEVFAWLNSDDTLLPGSLMTVGSLFGSNPDLHFLYGDYNKIDEQDLIIERKRQPPFHFNTMRFAYLTVPQQAAFWRASLYRAVGGIDATLQFAMDYDLFIRMAARSKPVHVRQPLANFRIHEVSKTSRLQAVRKSEDDIVRARYCPIPPKHPLFRVLEVLYLIRLVVVCAITGCLGEKAWNWLRRKIAIKTSKPITP